MSFELIGGALVGAVVSELLKAVIQAKAKATSFKPYLEKLTTTLESVIPKVEEIKRLDDEERRRTDGQKGSDLNRLIMLLIEGKILVEKCSEVQSWNYIAKKKYSGKIQELDNNLIRFFQLDVQAAMWLDVGKILSKVNDFDQRLKQLTTERDNDSSSNNGVGARDGDGVNYLKAAAPTKPTMMMTSAVPQKESSANAYDKLDRQFERAALIKPIKMDHDLKAAVPTTLEGLGKEIFSTYAEMIRTIRFSQFEEQLKQLTTERENGSSNYNGAAARDGVGGVNDMKSSVPIKPTMMRTSVSQKVGSAEASQKLKSAAPIKPRNHDPKAAVPIKPAIILTSADPQKVGSEEARLVRHSESSGSIKPYNHHLKAAVPITSDDRQKNVICTSETTARTSYIDGLWYGKSFSGVAKTSLSQGLDLNFSLNCDSKKISTNIMDIENSPPWILSETTTPQLLRYMGARFRILTIFHNYRPLATDHIYDRVKREHHKHMELVESIRHENVVQLSAYYCHFLPLPDDQPGFLNMKMVLVYYDYSKGSVHKMLHGKLRGPFDWDTRIRVAVGVARGVAFIHRQDNGTFFHGGIKSKNIFLNTGNYGCISELGKSMAGYTEPYLTGTGSWGRLQELDVYDYGIFLLELVTGNYPYDGIVENFKTYVGSREQLDSMVEYFIRPKLLNREEFYFKLLDPELVKHYGELKGQLIQMLRVAWKCVAYGESRAPKMNAVVKMVEFIGRLQLPLEFRYPFQDY